MRFGYTIAMADPSPAQSSDGQPMVTFEVQENDPLTDRGSVLLFRRYRVIRELGRGGMGVVLLTQDTVLDIPVAVKLLPQTVTNDSEGTSELRKEVLRGMALMHSGIVRTHTFERDETGAGVVMEYVEGETLADLKLQQLGNCFDPNDILPWLEQLCNVLDYAHSEARIVHRDLKPRNIMLTTSGRIKVADFGISAVLCETTSRHSMEGRISGTLGYMSPQQAQGMRPSHLDDIHALGATVYDLLTGRPPFFRGNPASIQAQIVNTVAPSLAERRADLDIQGKQPISTAWEKAIAACLAKEPSARPQTAREFLAMLSCSEEPSLALMLSDAHKSATKREPFGPRAVVAISLLVFFITVGAWSLRFYQNSGTSTQTSLPTGPHSDTPDPFADTVTKSPTQSLPNIPDPFAEVATPSPRDPNGISAPSKPPPVSSAKLNPQTPPEKRYQELVQQGKQLRDRGDTGAALVKLREAIALEPQNPEGIAETAVTYERMSLMDRAAEQWKRIFEMGEAAGNFYIAAESRMKMSQAQAIAAASLTTPIESAKSFDQRVMRLREAAVDAYAPRPAGLKAGSKGTYGIKPPFGLDWGVSDTRLSRMLTNSKATIVSKRSIKNGLMAWDVDGIVQPGLKRTIFYFNGHNLAHLELIYQRDDWDQRNYDQFLDQVVQAVKRQYGEGRTTAEHAMVAENVEQRIQEYSWTAKNCSLRMRCYTATSGSLTFRTISADYRTD